MPACRVKKRRMPDGIRFPAQITPTNVDIAAVAPVYHLYSQAEIEEVVSRL